MNAEALARACERKFVDLVLDKVEPDGTFSGYASLFGKVDLGKDVVERGAFANSLRARGAAGIRMLFQHDPGEPIGADEPLPTGEPYDPAEYPGYAAPDDGGAVAADAGKVREALAAMRAWFGIVVEKIDLDPDDTIVAVSAIGKDGKQEVARRSLRQIFEQADEALS